MSEVSEKLLADTDGRPLDRIVGFETEYGLNTIPKPRTASAVALNGVLRSVYGDPENFRSKFYKDGSRRYLDVGLHPEYSTAEEVSFEGAAIRQYSGHVQIARQFEQAGQQRSDVVQSILLVANTCDKSGESWGNHENYGTRRGLGLDDFVDAFAVHNLSRIVWSGAGHVQKYRETGAVQFELSEKADQIWEVASMDTTRSRGLVNTRDEPLANAAKYRRIHNITGESVFSPFVNRLRLASASIILRACELGVQFDDLMPEDPVGAIRKISHDPSLKAKVELKNGKKMTGLDLQREVAERSIRAAFATGYLTPQEIEWADKWLEVLDDLGSDPEQCDTRLDWVMKRRIIDKAMSKPSPTLTPYDQAFAASAAYHMLLPAEGAGMRLLRAGFFDGAPDMEVVDEGPVLPETRAKVRGAIIDLCIRGKLRYHADWQSIYLLQPGGDYDEYKKYSMPEPYLEPNLEIQDEIMAHITAGQL